MRDVNYGWLIRYLHSNTASAFFFLVKEIEYFYDLYFYIFTENDSVTFMFWGINSVSSRLLSKLESSSEGEGDKGLNNYSDESKEITPKILLDSFYDKDLIEWFIGFVDAEGCFFIQSQGNSFKFMFIISLHKDEYPLLEYVKQRLGVGGISVGKESASYTVTSKADLLKILTIMDKRSLNTSKNLNYIMFRKAYDLYFNRESIKVSIELREKLIGLKDQMNKKRIEFNQPKDHSINITPYWFLGFIEGDGYFSVNPKTCSLKFGIGQTSHETGVMEAIKKFLLGLPGKYSIKRKNSNLVKLEVYDQAKGRDHRPMVHLTINQTDFLTNVVIPFFDNLIWLSKKEKDYQDWRLILNIIKQGKHFTDKGKKLISLISKRINNNRLSTNLASKEEVGSSDNSIMERALKLLESPSNYEVQSDGKILIKSLGTYLKGRGNVGVKVIDENGVLVYDFSSIKDCALFFNVHSRTIIRRLENGSFTEFNEKKLVFKRELSLP